jgi:hypothetical protein
MRLTLRPRHNVMDVDFDVSTSGDGAPMAGLDKDAAADFSRHRRSAILTCIAHSSSLASFARTGITVPRP